MGQLGLGRARGAICSRWRGKSLEGGEKIRFSPGHFGVSSVARFIELGELLGRRTISSFCFRFRTFGLFLVVSVSCRAFFCSCSCSRLVCLESFLLSLLGHFSFVDKDTLAWLFLRLFVCFHSVLLGLVAVGGWAGDASFG